MLELFLEKSALDCLYKRSKLTMEQSISAFIRAHRSPSEGHKQDMRPSCVWIVIDSLPFPHNHGFPFRKILGVQVSDLITRERPLRAIYERIWIPISVESYVSEMCK